ncbi:MAG: hypothetical protein KKH72_11305 [Alphaproteobacteria bacterium]|nr:hypothetical protein [Alphaproteobacteria bacterium]
MTVSIDRGTRLPERHFSAIGMEMIEAYLAVSGDDNPIHTDLAAARRAGLPERPVPGLLTMGLFGMLIHTWRPTARVDKLKAEFVAPILVGGDLTLTGRVVARDDQAGSAILRLLASQANKPCAIGEAEIGLGGAPRL